ncbi:hypothetical protein [Ahrensia sp. 13_GOM-1096m]|uniref:hypothetical protein n=1 Tax=Ahrensia sp. 13_GOM-1096m TaxID=1380380 RepID=UPI00047E407E|nr:hypothetical protein [Ahrensia sp. 13_GOM-1096m]
MVKRPVGPFWDASHHTSKRREELEAEKQQTPIRDKDNADKRISPPRFAPHGERNRAPRGMSGIKRDMPTPEDQKAKDGFKLGGPGDLKREFHPIARGKDKDRGHER